MATLRGDIYRIKKILEKEGFSGTVKKMLAAVYWRTKIAIILKHRENYRTKHRNYKVWLRENAVVAPSLKDDIKFSILVPVYNVEPRYLNKCVTSVLDQSYKNWELCLYDDCSTKTSTRKALQKWLKLDIPRIKIKFGKKNLHISGSSNESLRMATGDYIVLLDNDDELAPGALFEVVEAIKKNPKLSYVYSDEDKIDKRGHRFAPFFKPDWNPDLLRSQMYTCHLGIFKADLMRKLGGFRLGYEGSQDYDLVLRYTEKLKLEEIGHISKILYHWRTLKTSTASGQGVKSYTFDAAKKALEDFLKRNRIKGEVLDGLAPGTYRVKREILGNPSVDIIIPFKDKAVFLERAVSSVLEKTDYKNYRLVLVDNGSKEKSTMEYLEEVTKNDRVLILKYDKPFNYSAINNYAVSKSRADYILLLNNDTEVITSEWLTAMLEQAQRPEVGAVGAKLLYPDNRVQHAGVILGMGVAGHSHKLFNDSEYGYFSQLSVIRDYAAVTAASLLVSREKYLEVGGLNEKELKVAFNDVDFCLKLLKAGYLNVYTPYAKLYHYESVSRGCEHPDKVKKNDPEKYKRVTSEIQYMQEKWADLIDNDPYYNPNLSRVSEDFSLRFREDEF
ncbi:MAG: glycosyltransferase family 2 protein [Bacillota bacterium]|nr:glycosyltransferase family 2 protein [Bacillota bacterium]